MNNYIIPSKTQIAASSTFKIGKILVPQLKQELSFNYDPSMYKTGACSERIPQEKDWYYVRAASILKYLWTNPVGVKKLRNKYGGMRSRGSAPSKKYLASGFLLRHLVQELERCEYLGIHAKGRYTTEKGKTLIAKAIDMIKNEKS